MANKKRTLSSQNNAGLIPAVAARITSAVANQGSNFVPVTTTTGAFTLGANKRALVDSSSGAIGTITLAAGAVGDTFEVDDIGMAAATHNITVQPAAGTQLEDPASPGAYAALNTAAVFATSGRSARWVFAVLAGVGHYKLVDSTT